MMNNGERHQPRPAAFAPKDTISVVKFDQTALSYFNIDLHIFPVVLGRMMKK